MIFLSSSEAKSRRNVTQTGRLRRASLTSRGRGSRRKPRPGHWSGQYTGICRSQYILYWLELPGPSRNNNSAFVLGSLSSSDAHLPLVQTTRRLHTGIRYNHRLRGLSLEDSLLWVPAWYHTLCVLLSLLQYSASIFVGAGSGCLVGPPWRRLN